MTPREKHYHKFFPFRLSSFLSSFSPCLVVVLSFCSHALTPAEFSLRGRCVTPPLWEFGLVSPTLHYHRGRRSSARPPRQPVRTVHTRLQFSGLATQRRNEATKVLLYKKKVPTPLRCNEDKC